MKTYHFGKVILPSVHGNRITKVQKTRLFSIDLIKVKTTDYGQQVDLPPAGNPPFVPKYIKTHKNTGKSMKKCG
ncbi:hypothetical protein [Herbaspirillum camelliae]|uniref:hypothetical protein n=1 Tax=Herbaspirillum camelliae TaxID=1892903 RepID=UPI00117B3439|nr:hypothetical protein [Herbaspirillum camelliae]